MARPLITDEMWREIDSRLPVEPKRSQKGRPPVSDRAIVTGIVFVLKSGIAWKDLPQEMQCGCGMTCLRRLRYWQRKGVWPRIRQVLLEHDPSLEVLDWERVDRRRTRNENAAQAFLSQVTRSNYNPQRVPPRKTQVETTSASQSSCMEEIRP